MWFLKVKMLIVNYLEKYETVSHFSRCALFSGLMELNQRVRESGGGPPQSGTLTRVVGLRMRGASGSAPVPWRSALKCQPAPDTLSAMPEPKTPWPHAPTHQLADRGTYFVTASTYLREHHFAGKQRLQVLQRGLLSLAEKYGWRLEAWAIFPITIISSPIHLKMRKTPRVLLIC